MAVPNYLFILQRAKTKINIWFAPDSNSTSKFVIQAGKAGLFGPSYVWIFSDAYTGALTGSAGPVCK